MIRALPGGTLTTAEALDVAWVLVAAALVMFMQAGFSSLETGLVRTKNSINVAAKNFADFCLTAAVFWAFGFALMFGDSVGGWFGAPGGFFSESAPMLLAFFIFQVGFAGTATTIMSGAVSERMRFSGYLLMALVMSALIYPVFGHWAWGSLAGGEPGWLEDLGFIDFAGSTVVHSMGGWMALAGVILIGPRIGRFGTGAVTIHGHDLPVVTLGVFILWVGWFGFNGGSTLALNDQVPSIIVNTTISGAFGGLAAMAVSWRRAGRPDVATTMNGSLAGLVGVTASANIVSTADSVVIGVVAGIVMYAVTEVLERLKVDDVVGAVPVHLGAGIWGTLAVALFGSTDAFAGDNRLEQLGTQAIGVLVGFAWAFGVGYVLLRLINTRFPLRTDPESERIGLNVAEHGASTEILDLLTEMDAQRVSSDYSKPVSVEPNTEIGQIARQYNRVMEGLNTRTASLQLLRRTAAAANEAASVTEAMRTSLREVSAATGWPVGHVYRVSESDPNLLVPTGIWEMVDPDRFAGFRSFTEDLTLARGEGLPGRALEERRPVWLDVTASHGGPRAEASTKAGLVAGIAFPVFAGSEVVAVVEFFSDKDLAPDDDLLEVMSAVGTQLGRTVERTRSEEARFQTMVDNMPALVLLRDLEGRFVVVNRRYLEFYGLEGADVAGLTLVEANSLSRIDLQPARNADHDREVIEGKRAVEHEVTVRRGGREHVLAAVKFPITDHAGRLVAVGGIELDITERKHHEAELADLVRTVEMARDRAVEATEAKSRFLASMSHELRTPLNAILGFARLVRRRTASVIPERDAENLQKIQTSGEQLLALINDILDLSRIEAGRHEVKPGELELTEFVRGVVASVEPLISSDAVELVTDVGPEPRTVVTDEEKVRQILINLLSNAIKFTDFGSVRVTVSGGGGRVRIEVADTGIGIAEDALELIFEEFYQDSSSVHSVGTGLGLTISRQLARLLGGEVSVRSVLGEGSTFILDLPERYEPSRASAA